ncbi:MAG: putative transporter [Sutterella sp.]|nr:putative transporter [Sutterella sp.]
MDWFLTLLSDKSSFAHALLAYSLIIAAGLWIGRFKIFGVGIGITCVLFLGLVASFLGVKIDPAIISFFRNFGLVLFVFFIGLQVGPSFFSTLRSSGWGLNGLMCLSVLTSILITIGMYFAADGALPLPQLLGVHFGAVTSTPGLGATQEALHHMGYTGDIAVGYACAYPLSIIGIILVLAAVRRIYGIDMQKEEQLWEEAQRMKTETPIYFHVTVANHALDGLTLREIRSLIGRAFICSRILHDGVITSPTADTVVHDGDKLRIVANPKQKPAIVAFCGEEDKQIDLATAHSPLVSRTIRVTREEMNGVRIDELHLSRFDGVNITRVNRAGVTFFPYNSLRIQIGDSLNCVGPTNAVLRLAALMGNQEKRLERPNVFAIFLGIALGLILGSIPITIPGMPAAIKLGLAGGPLIAAILLSYYGPRFHLVTYTTVSANLMLREWGLTFFLASVGLSAGEMFFEAFISGIGWLYMVLGFIITTVPMLVMSVVARSFMKLNFHTIAGLIAGSSTSSSALSFVNSLSEKGLAVVGYSTVYPLAMFLRIVSGQIVLMLLYTAV